MQLSFNFCVFKLVSNNSKKYTSLNTKTYLTKTEIQVKVEIIEKTNIYVSFCIVKLGALSS